MGKKIKSTPAHRPNAPEFQQILQPQPPHNPYYPDPSVALLSSPPPPYSELSVPISSANQSLPMAQITGSSNISYPRIDQRATPGHHASVVIQSTGVPYDRRAEKYNRRVRSFNNQTMLIAILAIVLSVWAYNLYEGRPCVFDFTVIKANKDLKISLNDIRNMHLTLASFSGFLLLITLAKSATGYNSYLAYLAFYSPCAPKLGELATNIGRTFFGSISNSLPAPDKGVFGETNVFTNAQDDRNGVVIFIVDVINCIFYFAIFLSSTCLC